MAHGKQQQQQQQQQQHLIINTHDDRERMLYGDVCNDRLIAYLHTYDASRLLVTYLSLSVIACHCLLL